MGKQIPQCRTLQTTSLSQLVPDRWQTQGWMDKNRQLHLRAGNEVQYEPAGRAYRYWDGVLLRREVTRTEVGNNMRTFTETW
jgi:hypothetical protein